MQVTFLHHFWERLYKSGGQYLMNCCFEYLKGLIPWLQDLRHLHRHCRKSIAVFMPLMASDIPLYSCLLPGVTASYCQTHLVNDYLPIGHTSALDEHRNSALFSQCCDAHFSSRLSCWGALQELFTIDMDSGHCYHNEAKICIDNLISRLSILFTLHVSN